MAGEQLSAVPEGDEPIPLTQLDRHGYSRDDTGSLVIQGYAIRPADAGVEIPAGEQLVEIPESALPAILAAAELRRAGRQAPPQAT